MLHTIPPLPSAQRNTDNEPRFYVPAVLDDPRWAAAVATEQESGVSAEVRIFLDAQLEAGDVVLDAAPGFGFVALSAATAPMGVPSVFVNGVRDNVLAQWQAAARQAGGWLERFPTDAFSDDVLATLVAERLSVDGRVFIHADATSVAQLLTALQSLIALGRVVAICLSVGSDESDHVRAQATAVTRECGFVLHELQDRDGEPALFPIDLWTVETAVIGLPQSDPVAHIEAPSNTESTFASQAYCADETTTGFSFLAPYCRTGYGIVGAHLLREIAMREVPVAFFPIGAVDRSIVANSQLDTALDRRGSFNDAAPSVRLSQAFDLAMHVGRGPRIGFPIFELDRFNAGERHQLQRLDRICVTCEWARDVVVEAGLWRTPIDIVPLGVDRTIFHERVVPASRPGSDTVFMSVGKLEARKGQRELLRAFETAFTTKDAVRLVVICHNPFLAAEQFSEALKPFRRSPMASRISLVTQPFPTQRELSLAMAAADCGVFPVRAEGWNLEALEMLAMGKAVIATACTAHTAYLNDENARLITIDRLEESVPGEVHGRWAAWGTAQHDQLIEQLRAVHAERQAMSLAVNQAGVATSVAYSWAASAQALLQSIANA